MLTFVACNQTINTTFEGSIMGTNYKVLISGKVPSIVNEKSIFNVIDKVNQEMSTYIVNSTVNEINNANINELIYVTQDLINVLSYGQKICNLSKGAFDVSIGHIVNAWGFGPSVKDDSKNLEQMISNIGCNSFKVNQVSNSILKNKNVSIDLSAIAKGYAIDKLAIYLSSHSIDNYLIEIGGEIRVKGDKNGVTWKVGIENPFNFSKPLMLLNNQNFGDFSLATSGSYRNYKMIEGEKISHTFDPRTGLSVKSDLLSVSVIHNTAMEADTLATTLNVLGADKGFIFSEENNIKAIFVIKENDSLIFKTSSEYNRVLK